VDIFTDVCEVSRAVNAIQEAKERLTVVNWNVVITGSCYDQSWDSRAVSELSRRSASVGVDMRSRRRPIESSRQMISICCGSWTTKTSLWGSIVHCQAGSSALYLPLPSSRSNSQWINLRIIRLPVLSLLLLLLTWTALCSQSLCRCGFFVHCSVCSTFSECAQNYIARLTLTRSTRNNLGQVWFSGQLSLLPFVNRGNK